MSGADALCMDSATICQGESHYCGSASHTLVRRRRKAGWPNDAPFSKRFPDRPTRIPTRTFISVAQVLLLLRG